MALQPPLPPAPWDVASACIQTFTKAKPEIDLHVQSFLRRAASFSQMDLDTALEAIRPDSRAHECLRAPVGHCARARPAHALPSAPV